MHVDITETRGVTSMTFLLYKSSPKGYQQEWYFYEYDKVLQLQLCCNTGHNFLFLSKYITLKCQEILKTKILFSCKITFTE